MKLRDHPGISSWPPSWLAMSGSQEKKLTGEFGILTKAALSRVDPITICYLMIRFENEPYMGTLSCKDSKTCRTIHQLLENSIGKTIREIGDLTLPQSVENSLDGADT